MSVDQFTFFPGFFDSDGRPWEQVKGGVSHYQEGLRSALKSALLCQRTLQLPSGYLLDNPALQRIFLNYRGNDDEARSFRALMQDMLRISLSDAFDHTGTVDNWETVLEQWITGTASERGIPVYLNCVPHEVAIEIQKEHPRKFIRRMTVELNADSIDLPEFIGVLNRLKLNAEPFDKFNFDKIIREKLLSGDEKFHGLEGLLHDKVHAIADAASQSNIRLSRSLLNSPELCSEIGAAQTLTRAEYTKLAPILAHYHHWAFANATGSSGMVTFLLPTASLQARAVFRDYLNKFKTDVPNENKPWSAWPLSRISFKDIAKARLGAAAVEFDTNLNEIYQIAKTDNLDGYRRAVLEHARCVAGRISLDFKRFDINSIADLIDADYVYPGVGEAKITAGIVKLAIALFRDFSPNIRKEMQIRWFFRKVRFKQDE